MIPHFDTKIWKWSEKYKSDFNRDFRSQMVVDHLWRLWLQFILLNNERKQIFPYKFSISPCSSDVQKSYCKRTFYQQICFISQQLTWKVGRGNAQIWERLDVKCQIRSHTSSPCSKVVIASPELESTAHIWKEAWYDVIQENLGFWCVGSASTL